jgi:hypothetical protein
MIANKSKKTELPIADLEDIICFVNEMKKAILHISKKAKIKTFPQDIQRSIIELHRTIKAYEKMIKEELELQNVNLEV